MMMGVEQSSRADQSNSPVVLKAVELTIRYGEKAAVQNVTLPVSEHQVTAIIGPSGCGKSTLLRQFNRMNEFSGGGSVEGRVEYRGDDTCAAAVDPNQLRRQIGMVFQKPNPFAASIYENIAWAPRLHRLADGDGLRVLVEQSLKQANLWDEVKDRLFDSSLGLSGGQQQRLCIARTLAMKPDVILMDEPCSALDPDSTAAIEELIFELKQVYTIVIVTHNLAQARRVSDFTAYLDGGELVEFGPTGQLFTSPREARTARYVSGKGGRDGKPA